MMALSQLFNSLPHNPNFLRAKLHSSVGNVAELENRSLVRPPARPILLLRIDDSHCDRTHSSLTAVRVV